MGLMWLNEHVLHMAALGELQMLKYLKEERKLDSMLLHPAAAAGVLAPLAEILADNPIIDVDIADEKGYCWLFIFVCRMTPCALIMW